MKILTFTCLLQRWTTSLSCEPNTRKDCKGLKQIYCTAWKGLNIRTDCTMFASELFRHLRPKCKDPQPYNFAAFFTCINRVISLRDFFHHPYLHFLSKTESNWELNIWGWDRNSATTLQLIDNMHNDICQTSDGLC